MWQVLADHGTLWRAYVCDCGECHQFHDAFKARERKRKAAKKARDAAGEIRDARSARGSSPCSGPVPQTGAQDGAGGEVPLLASSAYSEQ